jgi:hypothetical protein
MIFTKIRPVEPSSLRVNGRTDSRHTEKTSCRCLQLGEIVWKLKKPKKIFLLLSSALPRVLCYYLPVPPGGFYELLATSQYLNLL